MFDDSGPIALGDIRIRVKSLGNPDQDTGLDHPRNGFLHSFLILFGEHLPQVVRAHHENFFRFQGVQAVEKIHDAHCK